MEQAFELWINPEIERRQREGRLEKPVELCAAQVVFNADSGVEVRINSEVRGRAQVRVNRPIQAGDAIAIGDIAQIVDLELIEGDANSAHITLIRSGVDMWTITFDARYNRSIAKAMAAVAGEYIAVARYALERGFYRGLVDNLYSAVELAAKGRLILIPNPKMLESKTHGYIVTHFNLFGGKLGNAPESHVKLLNTLSERRGPAKYKMQPFAMAPAEAQDLLREGEEMVTAIAGSL
jgi:uncharacterized protein (UPF0332 family)